MRRAITLFFMLIGLIGCGSENNEQPQATSYSIDVGRITVSGLSAGGYMAGQLHLAHSNLFNGVAILAGGPYWCAQGSLSKGLGPCLKGGDVELERLLSYAQQNSQTGRIDSLANLSDDTVWLFHGANDSAVGDSVVTTAAEFYTQLAPELNIEMVTEEPAVHGMPTLATGAACDSMEAPFLNACGYDTAGILLQALYGTLNTRTEAEGELQLISQPNANDAQMLESAYLYVPKRCADGESCGLHVALHGCQQSSEFVGRTFASGAGYNEWAEANDLLVLYPQVSSSRLAPLNPLGCWDWWGYTNENYATKDGAQISVIKATMDALAIREL